VWAYVGVMPWINGVADDGHSVDGVGVNGVVVDFDVDRVADVDGVLGIVLVLNVDGVVSR